MLIGYKNLFIWVLVFMINIIFNIYFFCFIFVMNYKCFDFFENIINIVFYGYNI